MYGVAPQPPVLTVPVSPNGPGGVELPRLAENQNIGRQVSPDELIAGDLLVWNGHVAMYAGNGQIIEAGDPVQLGSMRTENLGMEFKGYFRPD